MMKRQKNPYIHKKKKTFPHSNYTSTENVAFCGKDTRYRNSYYYGISMVFEYISRT